jgi:hypothetical protein
MVAARSRVQCLTLRRDGVDVLKARMHSRVAAIISGGVLAFTSQAVSGAIATGQRVVTTEHRMTCVASLSGS